MPIAELLGVQFDMQLGLKLSISVAAVVLVSWVYRFYSSRGKESQPVEDNKDTQNATCQNCKTALRCQNSPQHDAGDGSHRPVSSHADSTTEDLPSHRTEKTITETHPHQADKGEDALTMTYNDQDVSTEVETLTHQNQAEVATSNVSVGSALNLPDPTETGMISTTGRRSPCFLQRLEGIVGVGRELRQDLEHQGAYSSFLSKAEIKVEDANVVLEGTGDEIVRGKIYDYYVESSSRSVSDSHTVLGQYERNSEPQPVEFGSRVSSPTDSSSSLSPIIMRDLVLSQSTDEDVSSLGSGKLRHPARQVLLRKESYLSAAEQCALPIPFITSTVSAPIIQSLASASNEPLSVHPLISLSTDSRGPDVSNGVDLETVAGAPFLHLPVKTLDGTNLESLTSKLDLGNCLETLYLAKKHGQTSVQQAALQVMSDNYLQVLRDPNIYGRLMAGEREQIQRQRTAGRRFVMVADMDPQDWTRDIGGQAAETEQKRTSSAVYYYDDYKDSWQTLCLIPQEVISKACAMCTMDNYLFVAVGCQCTGREITPSKRVFCYNPLTSIWKEISPMNEARPRCKLATLEGYIYAIGGECLSSVERYDPRLDRWTFVAPLPNDTFAVAHHVTVCNGELFVSGGTLRYMLLRYSPKTNAWRPSLLVGNKDRTADMVAVGRCLYRFDVNPLLGVSVYRYHTVARVWYECSSKRLQRCPVFRCVTMDGTIYCINRQYTMKFEADEISPAFTDVDLSVLSAVKGILIPFVLTLPDKEPRQTSV
ncbi:kelch domain-containing 7A-like [Solea senegalensis]|uniref:Kelch domain-containing 7A-like n=1 Tax=Solea senegalensis TaxID=28829 RepID=A0AAV6QM78_SOLSE|nr:kelch domain-containing protein 7A [Solea senegalensis]KAG7494243.1 kelch domain-containing 7A-like [Solea senegalensis]